MVLNDEDKKTFKVYIDSGELSTNQEEQNLGWVNIKKGSDLLNIVVPADQLEVSFYSLLHFLSPLFSPKRNSANLQIPGDHKISALGCYRQSTIIQIR